MQDRFDKLDESVQRIMDNHLAHLHEEITTLRIDVGSLKTDMTWLKKTYWIVASASIGGLGAAVIPLIL